MYVCMFSLRGYFKILMSNPNFYGSCPRVRYVSPYKQRFGITQACKNGTAV